LGCSRVSGYNRVPEPPTVARTWGNMAASFGFAQILSLSLRLVAAHDPQDDPGNHEGEQEEYDVEDNGPDLHGELIRSYWFIDLTESSLAIDLSKLVLQGLGVDHPSFQEAEEVLFL